MESEPLTRTTPGWAQAGSSGPLPALPEDSPTQRIGRAEREQADQHLRWALKEDVLTINEFDDRLGLVMQSKTRAELQQILADLPPPTALPPSQMPLRPCPRIIAVMGGEQKRGRWRPGRPLRLLAVMGGVVADLREAETHGGVFDVDALAFMGGIEIVVPDNANVDLHGFAVMGGRDNKVVPTGGVDGPLVRVNGYALMGGIVIRTASKRERKRHPVDDAEAPAAQPSRLPGPTAQVPPRPKSRLGRVVGLALLAALALGPGRAIVTADTVEIFGGGNYQPTQAQLSGDETVDVFTLFGGVDVMIPETHRARLDGFGLFGGTSCDVACDSDRSDDVVEVDAMAIFGGVSVVDEARYNDEVDELDDLDD